jgi:phytoene synthase
LAADIRDFELSRGHFDRLIDARERDLYDEPPASLAALEDYAEASSAPLIQLALEAVGAREPGLQEIARQVGIGYALAGLLRAMPFHAPAGRSYIPADIVTREVVDLSDDAAGPATTALRPVVREIAEIAAHHLSAARERNAAVPRSAIAVLLPAVIARRWLTRLRRAGYDPFAPGLAAPDPWQIWSLAAAALLNRF